MATLKSYLKNSRRFKQCSKLQCTQLILPRSKLHCSSLSETAQSISRSSFYQALNWKLNIRKRKPRAQKHHYSNTALSLPVLHSFSPPSPFLSLLIDALLSFSLFFPFFFLFSFLLHPPPHQPCFSRYLRRSKLTDMQKHVSTLFSNRTLGSIWLSVWLMKTTQSLIQVFQIALKQDFIPLTFQRKPASTGDINTLRKSTNSDVLLLSAHTRSIATVPSNSKS